MHRSDEATFVLTRYADVLAVLRDSRFSANPAHATLRPADAVSAPARSAGSALMLFMDPPDHTRLRRLVSKAFTPKAVEALRPRVAEIVDDLLDEFADRAREGAVDLIASVAYPLPVVVICEMLGVPAEDRDQFHQWSADATRLLDADLDDETFQRGAIAGMHFHHYFSELFEERRRAPRDDMLTALLAAEEAGDRLSDAELFATTILLFVAGHETTVNLLGNGTLGLLRHPDQFQGLAADPSLARSATDELLRYDSPVQVTARAATADAEVAGQPIRKGEQVVLSLAGANRDPDRFPDPDRLDLARPDNHHVAFSHGIHHCLGAALARLEGEVFFTALTRRFPDLELATDALSYRDHFVLRGLSALPLTLG
ncbi:MAG TPA: cytochrome P450 [Acidimicrobiia bacterium]|nr:cytochrome P450 [Acidimicrobiia bacterium]